MNSKTNTTQYKHIGITMLTLSRIFINGLLALSLAGSLIAEEPPQWVLDGILMVETGSYYRADGTIKYKDMRRGDAGEYGPFQMTRRTFNDMKRKGEQFWMLETDTKFAATMAIRYLTWLDKHYGHGDWHRNIEMYNAGPNNHSRRYLTTVLESLP
jgi:hypothetical protein